MNTDCTDRARTTLRRWVGNKVMALGFWITGQKLPEWEFLFRQDSNSLTYIGAAPTVRSLEEQFRQEVSE